ncbi:F0F1 ATP synthase subunit C [bacterium]|nr:F0F1 ATP synthase subunit C [bacterium]MBU1153388.1 F0F1 ATP synthase subunit C [bacterium]
MKKVTLMVAALLLMLMGDVVWAEEAGEAAKNSGDIGVGLKAIAAGLAVGLSALATGMAQAKIGTAGVGATAEKPEFLGTAIILLAIPETLVILGFVIAVMVLL